MGFRLLGACWGLGCGRARRGVAGSARIAIHSTLRPQTSLEGPVPFTAAVHSPRILSSCHERNKVGSDCLGLVSPGDPACSLPSRLAGPQRSLRTECVRSSVGDLGPS